MAWSKQLKVIQASCFVLVCLAHVPVLGHWLQEINVELHVLLIFCPRGLPVIQQKLQEWCSQRHEQSPLLNINAETLKIASVEGEFHWFLKCQETRSRNRWLSASHWASAKSKETVWDMLSSVMCLFLKAGLREDCVEPGLSLSNTHALRYQGWENGDEFKELISPSLENQWYVWDWV